MDQLAGADQTHREGVLEPEVIEAIPEAHLLYQAELVKELLWYRERYGDEYDIPGGH